MSVAMAAKRKTRGKRISTTLPKERPQNANLIPGANKAGRTGKLGLRTKVMKDALVAAATRAGDILYSRELTKAEKDKEYQMMLQGSGLTDYLTHIALTNEALFMPALTKVMPMQITTNAPVVSLQTFVDGMGDDEASRAYAEAVREGPVITVNEYEEED